MEREAVVHGRFQQVEAGRRELISGSQHFHCAIAAASGNKSGGSGSAVESEIQRTPRPTQSFVSAHKWRFNKDKYAQIDVVRTQKFRGGRKLFEGHALVESR
jgi:hypothetical protein